MKAVRELAVIRILVLEIVEMVRVQVIRMEHLETKQMVQRLSLIHIYSLSGRDRTGNLYFKTDSDIIKGSMKRVE